MRIIPVIDLKNGRVVSAREGRRESYPPLASRLTGRCDPRSVVEALRSLHSFDTFYLADLDALMGTGAQWPMLQELAGRYGQLTFWVDQGLPPPDLLHDWPRNVVPVIGTESLVTNDLRAWVDRGVDFVLSLDYRGERLVGDVSAVRDSQYWPHRVIVMSLSHVGSGKGPDFARLREFRRRHPETRLIAAGGVRDAADLDVLQAMGIHGVLLSSALHCGAIAAGDLAKYCGNSGLRPDSSP